jgi:hypothetical protein
MNNQAIGSSETLISTYKTIYIYITDGICNPKDGGRTSILVSTYKTTRCHKSEDHRMTCDKSFVFTVCKNSGS